MNPQRFVVGQWRSPGQLLAGPMALASFSVIRFPFPFLCICLPLIVTIMFLLLLLLLLLIFIFVLMVALTSLHILLNFFISCTMFVMMNELLQPVSYPSLTIRHPSHCF